MPLRAVSCQLKCIKIRILNWIKTLLITGQILPTFIVFARTLELLKIGTLACQFSSPVPWLEQQSTSWTYCRARQRRSWLSGGRWWRLRWVPRHGGGWSWPRTWPSADRSDHPPRWGEPRCSRGRSREPTSGSHLLASPGRSQRMTSRSRRRLSCCGPRGIRTRMGRRCRRQSSGREVELKRQRKYLRSKYRIFHHQKSS